LSVERTNFLTRAPERTRTRVKGKGTHNKKGEKEPKKASVKELQDNGVKLLSVTLGMRLADSKAKVGFCDQPRQR